MRGILYLWVLFLTVLASFGFFVLYFRPSSAEIFEPSFRSGAKIYQTTLSGLTISEATNLINDQLNQPYEVLINTKVIRIVPKELGIEITDNSLETLFRECHDKQCWELWEKDPSRLLSIEKALYESALMELEEQLQLMLKGPALDFDQMSLTAFGDDGKVVIDRELFNQALFKAILGKTGSIFLPTRVEYSSGWEKQAQATQKLIEQVSSTKLWIKIGRNQHWVDTEGILKLIVVKKDGEFTRGYFKPEVIKLLLQGLMDNNTYKVEIVEDAASMAVIHSLLFRAVGEDPSYPVLIPLEGKYSTEIPQTGQYIEVNKSQQRAYIFEDGKLVRTVVVGTGLLSETPTGNFQVLRHDLMAISYTGGWYMPYYEPLGTLEDGRSFFGFHEIPYQVNPQYGIVARDARTMGSPATHGCIQLTQKDAIWMFNWSDIGTPVIIVD